MRRRSKRGPNDSESTGKIGQEIPTNQPAPLRPAYPEPAKAEPQPDVAAEMHGLQPGEAARSASEADPAALRRSLEPQRVEVETQPESLATPPAEPVAVPARSPRGYVVLTIGLPGSGKTTWYKRRGVTPLSSDMLRTHPVRRHHGSAVPGAGVLDAAEPAARAADRQDAVELRGRDEPEPA